MLEVAILALHKASSDNPSLGKTQLTEVYEALIRSREAIGELGNSVNLVPRNSEWKYLYEAAPSSWNRPSFNDSSWKTGKGQLGYGDGDEATVLDYGKNPDNKPITAYFRREFEVKNVKDVSLLALDLVRDDGAAIYLNGTEVHRDNLSSGTLRFTTQAPSSPNKNVENNYLRSTISPTHLKNGRNVIAVEVHQNDPDSTDLSFDLQLRTNLVSLPETVLKIDIARLRTKLENDEYAGALLDWIWAELDSARKPRVIQTPSRQLLRGGGLQFEGFDLNGSIPPEALQQLIQQQGEIKFEAPTSELNVPSLIPDDPGAAAPPAKETKTKTKRVVAPKKR